MTEFGPEDFNAEAALLLPEAVLLPDGPARDYAVRVEDGVFQQVGPAAQLVADNPQLDPVRLDGHLLMPGFVDAHHHLTQGFGKSLAFGEPSEIYRRVWVPMENVLDDEVAYVSSKLTALEALRGGFTTVADAGTRAAIDVGAIAEATNDAGLRCVLGLICNDLAEDAGDDATRTQLHRGEEHLLRWQNEALVHPSLAVSVPAVASAQALQGISQLCADASAIFQIHVNEFLAGVERSLERTGYRPLEYLHQLGALGPQVLAAHTTLLTPNEIAILRETDTAISYNPVASAWKGNAVAPATLLASLGVRFGLGTDGTRGDGFRLAEAAEFAQRLAFGLQSGDASCGAGWTWLDHATVGGAEAVGLSEDTGEIAVGKAADFLVVDLQVPEMCPSRDLIWEIVRLANRDQLTAVVVNGELRLWQGWPTDWDGRALIEQAARLAETTVAQAPIQQIHSSAIDHKRRYGPGAAVP